MKKMIFKGCATALITPFTENSEHVDFKSFKNIIDEQIDNGVSALVFLGTTGEPATMTQDECDEVIKFAVKYVNHRVPVIAGAGSNNTNLAIEKSKRYQSFGVDALLHVTPYYNKCTQSGLIEHYTQIANSTDLPIIMYNVPGRTGVNLLPKTAKELSKIPNIVAIKEASGNIDQITQLFTQVKDDLTIYSGDDGITLPILSLGGAGVISVASNILPKEMSDMCSLFFNNEIEKSRVLQLKLYDFIKALFCEVNPIPIKTILGYVNKINPSLRLPLNNMQQANAERLISEYEKL